MPTTYTPIRYPGGKTKLYPQVKQIFQRNSLCKCTYYEAFAGGAGLACKLLLKNDVKRIVINDADRAVYCMWVMIVEHPNELCQFINKVDLSVEEWKKHRSLYVNQDNVSDEDLGKAAFYLNRTNVSGILKGGLIGGQKQNGIYKMNARFNRQNLVHKVEVLSKSRNSIEIHNLDAEAFIKTCITDANGFAYFDPPYVQKGPGLYRNSYTESNHRSLGKAINSCCCPWLVTYDSNPLIADIYNEYDRVEISIPYSAHSSSAGKEVLILSHSLINPFINQRNN